MPSPAPPPREGPVWVQRHARLDSDRPTATALHEHAALAFFTEGDAVIEQRGRFAVRAGDVLLVPPGEAHRFLSSKNVAAWGVGLCAACFAASGLSPLLELFERARAGASAVIQIPSGRHDQLARLCAELDDETRANRPHGELARSSLLALVLTEVTRAASAVSAPAAPGVVRDALGFIERHCLGPLSARDVAAALGKSPSYVTTAVKRATGKGVVEWITSSRLAEARRRLLQTDEAIDEVAERIGYADVTHFIRLFRRAHGATPAAWRASRRARGG